jgi:hypothetical protein
MRVEMRRTAREQEFGRYATVAAAFGGDLAARKLGSPCMSSPTLTPANEEFDALRFGKGEEEYNLKVI